MKQNNVLEKLAKGIIVSVQAEQGEPLYAPECILALAQSALNGGAVGLRLANPENVRLLKEHQPQVPVIGITKPPHLPRDPENHVYITPTLWAAESMIQAGADVVAMDATLRPRPMGESLKEIVGLCRERFQKALLMADIATFEEGIHAEALGFDIIGTTLSGYTTNTLDRKKNDEPDFELLEALVNKLKTPVILEGRIWYAHQVTQAFELGAYAVVVGSAITRPQLITKRFVQAIPHFEIRSI